MKKSALLVPVLVCLGLLAGCAGQPQASKRDSIPFTQGQLYAAAYLGYQQIDDLDYYVEQYLDSDQIPIHYLSGGDYYLVIPRYSGMKLTLYHNDIETLEPTMVYEDPDCCAFILQCNASDIFADVTISLTYGDERAEFSPFISLKDGSVQIGDQGLNLTRSAGTQQTDP